VTFTPVVPLGGFAGWAFLKRTLPAQQAAFVANAATQRDEAYFRANIGKIDTAEQLVADRRLLSVALGAYGLEADLPNKAFIRKVLEGGTLKPDALANRLADKQYQRLSAAFGFGDFKVPRNKISDFADKTLALYRARSFEVAVGGVNDTYRLALNAEREIPLLAARGLSEDAKWFTILGNAPLRRVVETALGLPSSFASIDLDKQLETVKARAERTFGADSVRQFTDPATMEKLVRSYLVRSELTGGPPSTAPGMAALTLLQQGIPRI
jgi:hypothetical protein